MKIYLGGLIGLVLSVVFSSCQKEVDGVSLNGVQEDTVLVRSAIYFDTTKAVGLDTIYTAYFFYDNKNRLIREYVAEYEYLAAGLTNNHWFDDNYLYTGDETKIYQSIQKQSGLSAFFTTFYFYGNNKFLIKDSVFFTPQGVPPSEATISLYSQKDQQVFVKVEKKRNLQTGAINLYDSILYKRVITGDNITDALDTLYFPSIASYTTRDEFTYDNKRNPFYLLAPSVSYWGNYFFTGDGYILPGGKNNAIRIINSDTYGGTPSQTITTINYTYRADGFPLSGRISGNAAANKVVFSYYN